MQRRLLGESGLDVSVIALGTWAFGATVETWGHVDDRESIEAIHQALDCGINLIDTAPIYGLGHSEEIVGKAIRSRRDDVVLATKCGLTFPRAGNGPPARCLTRKFILKECAASLRRLQTDHIDLYQCHWPDPATPISETMGVLLELREQGKIRAIGLSNYGCEEIAAARACGRIDAVQPAFSLVAPYAAEELIPYCREHRIAVLPYSPLAKGLLTGKFSSDMKFTDVRGRDPEYSGERFRRNLEIVEQLRPIAERCGKSVAQVVINWTLGFPGVTAPIVGAKRPSQVLENAGGAGWSLSDADRASIDALMRG